MIYHVTINHVILLSCIAMDQKSYTEQASELLDMHVNAGAKCGRADYDDKRNMFSFFLENEKTGYDYVLKTEPYTEEETAKILKNHSANS